VCIFALLVVVHVLFVFVGFRVGWWFNLVFQAWV